MENAGDLQELAPQSSTQLWVGFAFEGALGLFAGALALRGNRAGIGLGIVFILAGVGFPVAYWLWLANTRLLIGRGVIGYQNMFGQRRFVPTSEIRRAVRITIVYYAPRWGNRAKPALLLVGADGRCLLKLRVQRWREEAIDAFVAATGRMPEDVGYYTTGQVAREFPGSVGFMSARTGWTVVITVGIVIVVGGLFEWWILSSR